jgi:hypothetical protein
MELEEDEAFQRTEGTEIWAPETEEECLERETEEEELRREMI